MKQLCNTDNYLINIFNFVMDCIVGKGLMVTQLERFMAWVIFPKAGLQASKGIWDHKKWAGKIRIWIYCINEIINYCRCTAEIQNTTKLKECPSPNKGFSLLDKSTRPFISYCAPATFLNFSRFVFQHWLHSTSLYFCIVLWWKKATAHWTHLIVNIIYHINVRLLHLQFILYSYRIGSSLHSLTPPLPIVLAKSRP